MADVLSMATVVGTSGGQNYDRGGAGGRPTPERRGGQAAEAVSAVWPTCCQWQVWAGVSTITVGGLVDRGRRRDAAAVLPRLRCSARLPRCFQWRPWVDGWRVHARPRDAAAAEPRPCRRQCQPAAGSDRGRTGVGLTPARWTRRPRRPGRVGAMADVLPVVTVGGRVAGRCPPAGRGGRGCVR